MRDWVRKLLLAVSLGAAVFTADAQRIGVGVGTNVSTLWVTSSGDTADYYVDATLGDDANAGTAPGAGNAWQTTGGVDGGTFAPGDIIAFKCNETWRLTSTWEAKPP